MLSALQYSSGPRCSVKLKVFTPLFSQSPVLSNHGNTPADPSQETRRAADEAADEAAGGGVTATIEDSSVRTAGTRAHEQASSAHSSFSTLLMQNAA